VPGFVWEHSAVLDEIPFALVTMVDSSPKVTQIPWALPFMNSAQRSARSSLLLSVATVLEVVEEGKVLSGFDEVWVSGSRDPARPQPGTLSALRQLDESPLSPAEGSTATGMLLGLSDGYGLNFAAIDQPL